MNLLSALTLITVCQFSSVVYFIVVVQPLFANRMLLTIEATAPNFDAVQVLGTAASDIHHVFGGGDLAAVLGAYMVGIKDIFAFALASSACAVLVALVIPFKKLPDHNREKEKEQMTNA